MIFTTDEVRLCSQKNYKQKVQRVGKETDESKSWLEM